MLRIMFWSDPPLSVHKPPTAYGKVAQYLIDGFAGAGHEVAYTPMGMCNDMGVFKLGSVTFYPSGSEPFGEDVICSNCYHFNADLVFVLKDPFFARRAHLLPLEYLWYAPVDHAPLHPHYEAVLKRCLCVVAMSEFGRRELRAHGIEVAETIPHGYDPKIYRPLYDEEREECRKWLDIDPFCFLIGFIGRNQIRKQIDRLLLAFKRLIEENPDADIKLLLWTDVKGEVPLLPIIHSLGLHEYVYWPEERLYRMGIPEEEMHRFYNACDLVVCVSAEGFWLPGLEAMACGIHTLAPDYAAAGEIALFRVRVSDWTFNNMAGVRQPLIDVDDFCLKVMRVYDSDWEQLRRKQLERARGYEWDNIIPRWLKLLDKLEPELRPLVTKGEVRSWG
ncbi:MAG: hypothetical protein DRJ67_11780 [Thermoprotei archaeon]|nr:MAG: hypothetical protein DRJ67_11780 [Thermoprotei archaeon]